MLTNKGLKSLKYQTKFKSCESREFESMALDMNHSVPESNPFSSHSTVHTSGIITFSTFVLMTVTTFLYLCDHGPRAYCRRCWA